MTASIDVVSVAERNVSEKKRCHAAVLTYFYRRPELQMGEFERVFSRKDAARHWVGQFKGRQIMIHVNPADPADSILLDSDLEGLDSHAPPGMDASQSIGMAPVLLPGFLVLSSISELVSSAGLAASGVLLAMSIAHGGKTNAPTLLWTGAAILALAFLSMAVVRFHFDSSESAKSFLHNYALWSPAWMRWTLKVSGAVITVFFYLVHLRIGLPSAVEQWMKELVPHLPYVFGCWGFLLCASFHSAVQRSQELPQIPATSL